MNPAATETENGEPRPRPWHRRSLRAFVLYAIVPYLAVTVIFAVLQRQFLYPATQTDRLIASDLAGPRAGDVAIESTDGLTLHGWNLQSTGDENSLLVLYFPGNSGSRADRINDFRELTRLGADVLVFDYRGYGDSTGSPSESKLAADAQRVWEFATEQLKFPPERIVLLGESLGGAVAVQLAAKLSEDGTPPAGLILNSTFASLPETVAWHYPIFPFRWLVLDRYPSAERITRVSCPILQFHGTEDEFVPLEQGRRLFGAAPNESADGVPKRFVTIEGGTHNAIPLGRVQRDLGEFLRHAVDEAPPARSAE